MKNKIKSFFKQLKERFKTPISSFWSTIRSFSIILGTSSVAIIGVDKLFLLLSQYGVSPIIFTVCGYIIVFCAALGLAAQITDKHPEKYENNEE